MYEAYDLQYERVSPHKFPASFPIQEESGNFIAPPKLRCIIKALICLVTSDS